MHLSFASNGRLRYDEAHAVLICLECQYAVQKSAIESHLLRHKVYRGERRTLLAEIAQLHLAEPDDVMPPSSGVAAAAAPVEGLAVIPGYRCAADGCEALCASSKRMRRHWSEVHGTTDQPSASMASEAYLQTFFRGTKLRYFQVLVDGAASVAPPPPSTLSADSPRSSSAPTESGSSGAIFDDAAAAAGRPGAPAPLRVEMEALQYFHHFAAITSLTLPVGLERSTVYWQTDVVARALQLRWLMCAVLAMAATHKCVQSSDPERQQMHSDRAMQFQTEFLGAWPTQQGVVDRSTIELGAQIRCIQRLCQITCPSPIRKYELGRLEWSLLTKTIRGCQDPSVAILTAPYPSPYPISPAMKAVKSSILAASVANRAPPTLVKSLRELPFRMAVALSKPDSQEDLVAVVSAIETLMDCYIISYSADDDGGTAAWLGMECWLREVPDRFNDMLSQQVPAALIVLAHWCLLVKRVESHYWFLEGLEDKIVRGILNQVPNDDSIRELVEACRGSFLS
ncbi:hypothetical protein V2A60_008133 [Cordyceps javanica]